MMKYVMASSRLSLRTSKSRSGDRIRASVPPSLLPQWCLLLPTSSRRMRRTDCCSISLSSTISTTAAAAAANNNYRLVVFPSPPQLSRSIRFVVTESSASSIPVSSPPLIGVASPENVQDKDEEDCDDDDDEEDERLDQLQMCLEEYDEIQLSRPTHGYHHHHDEYDDEEEEEEEDEEEDEYENGFAEEEQDTKTDISTTVEQVRHAQSLLDEAMRLLLPPNHTSSSITLFLTSLRHRHVATKVLDAWIDHHDQLYQLFQQQQQQHTLTDTEHPSDTIAQQQQQQVEWLRDMRQAAKTAHNLLERLVPSLGQRHLALLLHSQSHQHGATTYASTTTLSTDPSQTPLHSISSSSSSNTSSWSSQDPSLSISDPSHSAVTLVDWTPRCLAVLTAWARTVQCGHVLLQSPSSSLPKPLIFASLRAIPQQAQYLLEQMECAAEEMTVVSAPIHHDPSEVVPAVDTNHDDQARLLVASTGRVQPPSVEAYNRVLQAWALSLEHLRGTMAERVFQQLVRGESVPRSSERRPTRRQQQRSRTGRLGPNAESYQWITLAWALGGERYATYHAVDHLLGRVALLEQGEREMEPNLEDYKIVLRALVSSEYV